MSVSTDSLADLQYAREKIVKAESDLASGAPVKRVIWGIEKAIETLRAALSEIEIRPTNDPR